MIPQQAHMLAAKTREVEALKDNVRVLVAREKLCLEALKQADAESKRGSRVFQGSRVTFDLPYPPSMNEYWHHNKQGHTYISAKGKAFTAKVASLLFSQAKITGDLRCCIITHPPDKRRRDIDNIIKPLWDALTKAGLIEDDSQFSQLWLERGPSIKGGKVSVTIIQI